MAWPMPPGPTGDDGHAAVETGCVAHVLSSVGNAWKVPCAHATMPPSAIAGLRGGHQDAAPLVQHPSGRGQLTRRAPGRRS